MPTPALTPLMEHVTGRTSEAKPATASMLPSGRPKFPKGLSATCRAEWKRICRLLERRGHITDGDGSILSLYASTWQHWQAAEADIVARGVRYAVAVFNRYGEVTGQKEKRNESVVDAANYRKELLQYLTALGLTPQSRDKVKLTAGSAPTEPNAEPLPGSFGEYLKDLKEREHKQ